CFICEGPHRARDCPRRCALNTMMAQRENGGNTDSEAPTRVAPLQLINALRAVPPSGLLYVNLRVQGQQVSAMVDTGATHSFLAERMVTQLGLEVDKHGSRIKAVNSQAQAMAGMAHGVQIAMGEWAGKIDLMVVPLDDFDLILGNNFFITEKVLIIPHLCGIFITNERNSCFVPGYNMATDRPRGEKSKAETLSAMQLA
ncbi:gag-asp_proteas domain-containing protein, partial [Cephalotus follicularis]